jgi:hypothetical protein
MREAEKQAKAKETRAILALIVGYVSEGGNEFDDHGREDGVRLKQAMRGIL